MVDDIKFFGVPNNVDTESYEAGQKASKTEAVKTQKRKDKFDEQVSIRLSERHLLDLAEAEIDGSVGLWQYFEKKHTKVPNNWVAGPHNNTEYTIEGAQLKVFKDDNGTLQLLDVIRKSMGNKPMLVEGSFRQHWLAVSRQQAGSFTEMFTHITTDVAQIQRNRVEKLQFYLADVKAFDHPIVVLPDIGRAPNSYIMVKEEQNGVLILLLG
jgi:hypothetical protein